MAAEVWAIIDDSARPFCGYTALDNFEDNSAATVPTEPQENGALYAYDKVPQPSECSVSLLFSGDYQAQQEAISRLESYRKGTQLFRILTPSKVYSRMAVVSYGFTRAATNGANALEIHVDFREIRSAEVGGATVTWSPKSANAADKTQTGQAQGSFLGDSADKGADLVRRIIS